MIKKVLFLTISLIIALYADVKSDTEAKIKTEKAEARDFAIDAVENVKKISGAIWDNSLEFANDTQKYFIKNMKKAINAPLMDGEKFETREGESFKTSLTCDEDDPKEYLAIKYEGDSEINVSIQIDKDLDGNKETSWSFNNISGICSNGVIKCSPRTWKNCNYYEWAYTTKLELNEVDISSLSGCYCINSSCGSLAKSAQSTILNSLGGGIVDLLEDSSQYVLTKTNSKDKTLKYLAQDYSNCPDYGSKPSVQRESSSSDIEEQVKATKQTQESDEKSLYSAFKKSHASTGQSSDEDKEVLDEIKKSISDLDSLDKKHDDDSKTSFATEDQVKYCEVEITINDTTVFSDGTTKPSLATKTNIRECINNWTRCPVNSGEKIKHECGAVDDFKGLVAALQNLNKSSKDVTCSKE